MNRAPQVVRILESLPDLNTQHLNRMADSSDSFKPEIGIGVR